MKGIPPKNNSPIQQSDPRIDELVRGYSSLSKQIEALTEQVKKQQEEVNKAKDELALDAILTELEKLPFSSASQGRAPPEQPAEKRNVQRPPTVKAVSQQSPAKGETEQKQPLPKGMRRKRQGLKMAGSVAFYAALMLLIVIALFIRVTSNGSPRSLVGFTGMIVLTESMQSEIPKGSLVIAQQVDPKTLQIGDDITYMANQTTTVTHRIVGIVENYENTGQRAFQTQGIMNAQPDKQPVHAANVVGKVVFHSVVLGMIAGFIGEYWMFLLFALAVVIGLVVVLKRICKKEPKETEDTDLV